MSVGKYHVGHIKLFVPRTDRLEQEGRQLREGTRLQERLSDDSPKEALAVKNSIQKFGSTTVKVGNWKKEADSCWSPVSQLPRLSLSFVMEVGLSESTRYLSFDARHWLETPSSSVKLVVTIEVTRQTPEIILNRWEIAPFYGIRTRSHSNSAHRTVFVRLSRANNVTSVAGKIYTNGIATATTQLPLPFEKIVGRRPQPLLDRDLVLSEKELRFFAEGIWQFQRLM